MKRTLTLKSETLTALSAQDLSAVAGGAKVGTSPINECLSISFEFTCLDCITRRSCE